MLGVRAGRLLERAEAKAGDLGPRYESLCRGERLHEERHAAEEPGDCAEEDRQYRDPRGASGFTPERTGRRPFGQSVLLPRWRLAAKGRVRGHRFVLRSGHRRLGAGGVLLHDRRDASARFTTSKSMGRPSLLKVSKGTPLLEPEEFSLSMEEVYSR